MGLITPEVEWVPGRKYKIINREESGMYSGEYIVLGVETGEAKSDTGGNYFIHRAWLTDGTLQPMEEEEMGLIFAPSEPEVAEVKQHIEVVMLRQLIDDARGIADHNLKHKMLDCINEKYRSAAYKRWFKGQMDAGLITEDDKLRMENLLRQIRHCVRTPRAKSYRYIWF